MAYAGGKTEVEIRRMIFTEANEKYYEIEIISIDIPRGVENNFTLCLHGQGNRVKSQYGDVEIILNILPHKVFTREGSTDLAITIPLTFKESFLGIQKTIHHLDGSTIMFDTRDIIVMPHTKHAFPGRGMPRPTSAPDGGVVEFGSLLVSFAIEYPVFLQTAHITEEQRAVLERVFDGH
jgi:DnaJ family protein B protein 4